MASKSDCHYLNCEQFRRLLSAPEDPAPTSWALVHRGFAEPGIKALARELLIQIPMRIKDAFANYFKPARLGFLLAVMLRGDPFFEGI